MNRNEALTPEERQLARLLGRTADKAPPPALDAAILAAARASLHGPAASTTNAAEPAAGQPTAAPARRQHGRQPRWPAVFGVAASVVFAVGIAWQLRPEPPQAPVPETGQDSAAATVATEPMAAAATEQAAAVHHTAVDAAAVAAPAAAPPAAPEAAFAKAAGQAQVHESMPAPAPASPAASKRAAPAPAPERTITPAVAPAPPAPIAPPPAPAYDAAPAAAPMMARQPVADMAGSAAMDHAADAAAIRAPRAMSGQAAPASAPAPAMGAPGVMRRNAAGALSAEAVHEQVLADSQLPRRQWLHKIRERRDAGDLALARASLERYLQQYPEARLPPDVRSLLDD